MYKVKAILHIVRKPIIGGSEILVKYIISNNYLDNQFSHFMLYSIEGSLIELYSEDLCEKLVHVKSKNKLIFILRLREVIKSQEISIIHTHQPIDAIFAILASIGLKTLVVKSYHGFEGIYNKSKRPSIKNRMIYAMVNRFVCMNIFVSEALLKHLRQRNPKQSANRQTILHNGVDYEELISCKPVLIKRDLRLLSSSIVMGMIGGFTTQGRDQFTICEAMKILLDVKKDVHFVFIGRTNNSEHYKKCFDYCLDNKILSNVHFLGEQNSIGGFLKSLDVYVHSSNNDTFGLALVEAIFCNVPCIASNIPAFREISKNGELVTLFEKGNARDLAIKIIQIIDSLNTDSLRQRTEMANQYAWQNFSISAHLSQLHYIYKQCLKPSF